MVTPNAAEEAVTSGEGTALLVVATGLLALVAPVPVQVLWLVAALAASVATMRARPAKDDPVGETGGPG